jgi:hypothetical protein
MSPLFVASCAHDGCDALRIAPLIISWHRFHFERAVDDAIALSTNAATGTACVTQRLKDRLREHFEFNCVGCKALSEGEATTWELAEDSFVGGSFDDRCVANLTKEGRMMFREALEAVHKTVTLEQAVRRASLFD